MRFKRTVQGEFEPHCARRHKLTLALRIFKAYLTLPRGEYHEVKTDDNSSSEYP